MVATLTVPSIRASAFATLSLANNLLGLALGPIVTGRIADSLGLAGALRIVPWVGVLAIPALLVGWRTHHSSLTRLGLAGPGVDTGDPDADAAATAAAPRVAP